MALASGSRIGPYEILAPLGAGGMGQVFRARDTQLGREVAIKALPDLMAGDPARVARFQREAQVLASLNHPNIAGIHGLQEDGPNKYLVLELVDGETLADHLAKLGTGMPLVDALPVAREIIDALEAAHDKGIVHRDLKPANIMLTAEAHVKVLDFGLARVVESDPAASTTDSPTFTMAATQAGFILGTAAYMSPEQAKGRVADKRSDVWAFGCVFYEMLTGKRVFEAEDVSETLAAVLRGDPDYTKLPANLPPGVRALIPRCLERDRKTRIPDLSVVRFLLEEALAPSAPVTAAKAPSASPMRLTAAFVAGLVVMAAGAWVLVAWRPAPDPPRAMRFGITPPVTQRLGPTTADRQLAISPDGRVIVYVSGASSAGGQLMLRSLDQLDGAPIVGANNARHPFFSPDGKWVGYFGPTDLRKVQTSGGPFTSLCATDGPPRGATWTDDDTIVFATAQPGSGLQSVLAAGGIPKNLTTPSVPQGEGDHVFPSALPGGRGILFTVLPPNLQAASAQVAVWDPGTGASTVLIRGASSAEYVEPGYLLYASANAVRAIRFDLAARKVLGEGVPVLDDPAVVLSGAGQFSLSKTGILAYVPAAMLASTTGGGSTRTLVWVNRQGREEAIKAPPRAYFALRLSPDGTRVALDIRDQDNDIWVWDLARHTLTRLTFDQGADLFPVWTRDSKRILFSSAVSGAFNIYAQAADGTGAPERLTDAPYAQYAMAVTPDGSSVLVNDLKAAQNPDVSVAPIATKGPSTPLLQSPATERAVDLSPDGKFIAYESAESDKLEIFVRPFPNVNDGKWQMSTAGGTKPAWSPSGRELFYVDSGGSLMSVSVQLSPAFKAGNPTKLFPAANIATLASGRFYDVSRDGQKFVMIKELPPPPGQPATPAGPTFVVVLNWLDELKAQVGK